MDCSEPAANLEAAATFGKMDCNGIQGETADLTSGKQIRDFLDVADAGRMIADVALSDQTGPVNICSGEAITVRQLAERIAGEYGRPDLLNFGARAENTVDPQCVICKKENKEA